ncbi:hypothetical protein [Mycolicibacterium sp.]|uniref:hypothetical protein n=1 Tax=Mycolicibacterium sp. TaxID=2320850 RepID=UPI0037C836A6
MTDVLQVTANDVLVLVLLAVLVVLVYGYLIRAHLRRTQLRYTIGSTPMFAVEVNATLAVEGAVIGDPHLVWISVAPRGEWDIWPSHFKDGAGLQIDLGAVLVADLATAASSLAVNGERGDRHATIAPQLLKRGVPIPVGASFIVDGPPVPREGIVDVRTPRTVAALSMAGLK